MPGIINLAVIIAALLFVSQLEKPFYIKLLVVLGISAVFGGLYGFLNVYLG